MNTQALVVELLLSGFFAVACFRARAEEVNSTLTAPGRLFALTDRVERLRRSRWQWFAMVLVIVMLRLQRGVPIAVELTGLAEFLIFLCLPTRKSAILGARGR